MKDITVKPAQSIDVSKVYDLERLYILEHEPHQITLWDSAKERTMTLLHNNLHRMFVALKGDLIIGHAYWSIHEDNPCVYSIFIHEDYRRLGLASHLLKHVEESITSTGYHFVTLSTLVTNPAQYLFSSRGYTETERKDGWIHYSKNLNSINV